MYRQTLTFLVLLSVLTLSGCGNNDAFSSGSGTTGGTGTGTGGTTGASDVYLGNGFGSGFQAGVLDIAVPSLSAGGTSSVTATLADASGNLYTDPVDVTFASACTGQGTALLGSPVTSASGYASTTYQAQGCQGPDTITAQATVNGQTLTATGTVTVQAAELNAISFVSATPSTIGIKGVGLNETSTVVFKVVDKTGGPVANQDVAFSLDTTVGGISISPTSATTGTNGEVQTIVTSGTVPTVVKVTATVVGVTPTIATQSNGLVVSTGIADQDSFSLSAEELNPEAWNYDNEQVTISVLAADHFNNPVTDGTPVYFTTEGGQIDPSCTIVDGGCSVTWRSSEPRPAQGRVTILAAMQGEESFTDLNGNGLFDDSDPYTDLPGEAFRDDNENGVYDATTEEFRDFNQNGLRDGADSAYNGLLCSPSSTKCSATKSIEVRDSLVLVMAESFANIAISSSPINAPATVIVDVSGATNGQPMPYGTTVSFETTNGKLLSKASYTITSTNFNGPTSYAVTIDGDGTASSGLMTITVTTPKGNTTYKTVTVND